MSEPAIVATERRGRRWWWVPVLAAAVLVAAAVVGRVRPGNFVVLSWLGRPFLFGALALGLLALAVWVSPLRTFAWRAVLITALVVASVFLVLGKVFSSWFSSELSELSRHPSPDGTKELRLYRGSVTIDPTWELRLRSGSGLTERVWDLGCVNSDSESLTKVEWLGPDQLRVHLANRAPFDFVLDSSTGRPDGQLKAGYC